MNLAASCWPARVALLALAVLVVAACGGDSPPPRPAATISLARAERDSIAGSPGVTSTLTVRFTERIEEPGDDLPFASAFELAVPDPFDETQTTRVFAREAAIVASDPRLVTVTFDSLVPDGATLTVDARILGKDATAATARVTSDVSALQALLASVAFGPIDEAILEFGDFRAPTEADRDTAAMRDALEDHFADRQASAEGTRLALERYDTMPADVVESPKLRAALAALTGTFAEGAIDDLLTEENCTGAPVVRIAFEDPPDAPDLFARVTHAEDGRRIISVSPRLEGEPFELLISVLAHEAIHCDPEGSIREEVVATAFDTLMYIQMLTVNPDLALHGSPLSKELNVDAIAMINSGRALPESIGILPSPAVELAVPNTTSTATSFAGLVASAYAGQPTDSPSEPLATLYAAALGSFAGLAVSDAFDLEYLDAVLGYSFDPTVLLYVIATLALDPVA